MWLHLDLITRVVGITADIFPTVDYAYTSIPTYPSGDWIIQIRLAANPCLTMTSVINKYLWRRSDRAAGVRAGAGEREGAGAGDVPRPPRPAEVLQPRPALRQLRAPHLRQEGDRCS